MANSNIESKAMKNRNNSCIPPGGSNHFQSEDFNKLGMSQTRRLKEGKFMFLKFYEINCLQFIVPLDNKFKKTVCISKKYLLLKHCFLKREDYLRR